MHNQMQNIFLEQIERFDGILIATTNLLENLDKAFSRRFNYKIEFVKPNHEQRLELWKKLFHATLPLRKRF
jgi:AAA+ superfamily predicted ATPase